MATTTPPLPSRLVGISDVADQLGVDVRHVRRLVYERRIPYIKWGHLLRFDPTEIATWIDTHRRHAGGSGFSTAPDRQC
jgi:excisionase family DNA binding protein